MDPILSLAHSIYTSPNIYAVLLGSGISRNAMIPTGWEVTLDLVSRLAALQNEDTNGDPNRWYIDKYGNAPGYSEMLDLLAKTPAERRSIMHGYFEPTEEERDDGVKMPTQAHRAIAELVRDGFVKVILTTNFDRLMETALTDVGIVPTVISTVDGIQGAAPIVHQRCVVIKLHGDYLDDRIKNTEDELATYDPALNTYLDRILDEFGLIICGWSGEWDQALRSALERSPSRRYGTYWAARGKLGARAERLLVHRSGHLVEINGADEFFIKLQEMVEGLRESQSPHPLTLKAQVAAAKKFVASPQTRVRFDDLLCGEAARVREVLSTGFPLDGGPCDQDALARRVQSYEASTAGLQHMLFAVAPWVEEQHFSTVSRSIRTLVPSNSRSGFTAFLALSKYPGGLCFFAASFGAVIGENWNFFRYLGGLRVTHGSSEASILEHLALGSLLEQRLANESFDKRYHTPVSERLLGLARALSNSDDLENEFNRYEVLLALQHLDVVKPHYPLVGRFMWNHSAKAIDGVAAEVERDGDNWSPVRAGLFGGTKASATALIEELRVFVRESQRYYRG